MSGCPVVTIEQSPLSAALDYIDAIDVKVAVKPEPGGGIRHVEAMKDKGLALARALLGVSAELQDPNTPPELPGPRG